MTDIATEIRMIASKTAGHAPNIAIHRDTLLRWAAVVDQLTDSDAHLFDLSAHVERAEAAGDVRVQFAKQAGKAVP